MDDLISREAAIGALDGKLTITGRENAETIRDYINGVDKKLRELPSAERRGRWIVRDNPGTGWYEVTCSECGEDVTSTVPLVGFFPDVKVLWDYCPNCGSFNGKDNLNEKL